jgi:hypothetical protein
MPWFKSNEVYTHDSHAGPTVIFCGDGTSGAAPHYAPNIWHTIDLKPLGVTGDAKFAEIAGHVIISHADTNGIADLKATFRSPNSDLNENNCQMQGCCGIAGEGQRGNQMVTVPLVNGCFQFMWKKLLAGSHENNSPTSYLLNLWLQKWGRWQEPAAPAPTPAPAPAPAPAPQVFTVPLGGCVVQFVPGS